jgi:hypothetical protein
MQIQMDLSVSFPMSYFIKRMARIYELHAVENQTLSSMKKQVSGYVKPEKNEDPVPSEKEKCHQTNITCI